MQRIDYSRIKAQVFDAMNNCASPYQEAKSHCINKGLPFGLREEEMVSQAIREFHGWDIYESSLLR